MKKIANYESRIDLAAEKAACLRYFSQYWDLSPMGETRFAALVEDILRAAQAIYGGFIHRYCSVDLQGISGDRAANIEQGLIQDPSVIGALTGVGPEFAWYDSKVQLSRELTQSCISTYVSRVVQGSAVYHLDVVEQLVERLRRKYPGLQDLRPFGYAAFTLDYSDYQGQEELDIRALRDAFAGHDVTTGRSFEFPVRIQLPHVAYDDLCQGRTPDYVAVASFVCHFGEVIAHNNTFELMAEWRAIDWAGPVCFNEEFQIPEGGWIGRLWAYRDESDRGLQPLTESMIIESRRQQAEYAALSEEAKAARKRAAEARMSALIKTILMENENPEKDAKPTVEEVGRLLDQALA